MSMRVSFSDMGAMWFVVSVVIVDGASRAWLFYVTRTTQSQRQVCVVVERQNVRPHCRGFNRVACHTHTDYVQQLHVDCTSQCLVRF